MPYTCATCGEVHEDIPSYGSAVPAQYWQVPPDKIKSDVFLTSDSCVILDKYFFIRGCIEIPIHGQNSPWVLGAWVSLKEENFMKWQECYNDDTRDHVGPFFGWLCSSIPCYEETMLLKTMAHLQNNTIRPRLILEPTDHKLSVDQRNGVDLEYVWKMIHDVEEKCRK